MAFPFASPTITSPKAVAMKAVTTRRPGASRHSRPAGGNFDKCKQRKQRSAASVSRPQPIALHFDYDFARLAAILGDDRAILL